MRTYAVAVLAALISTPVAAVEFTGGSIDAGYSQFTDGTLGKRFSLAGSAELSITKSFGIQADIATYNFQETNISGQNLTLHGVFHISPDASIGGFYGQDKLSAVKTEYFGIEAGYDFGRVDLEGYISSGSIQNLSGSSSTLAGAELRGAVTNEVFLTAKFDYLDAPVGINGSRFSVGADYTFQDKVTVYGELGSGRAQIGNASGTEPFVGIGLRFNLGTDRGTTFGRRGLLDKIPGL